MPLRCSHICLLALLCLFLLPRASCSHSNTFFVLGDWGSYDVPAYAPTQKLVAKGMALAAADLNPEFIVSVGDNFYDSGVSSTKDSLWDDAWVDMYSDSALQVPWYIALGNRDWKGSLDAQLQYKNKNWILPHNYYSKKINHLNATLVVIDTTPLLNTYRRAPETNEMAQQLEAVPSNKPQYAWLESTLAQAANESRWLIVVGHHPIYSGHASGSTTDAGFGELQEGVLPLLTKYGAHLYLCGHVHTLQHIEAYGVHYLVSGAGSRIDQETKRSNTASSRYWSLTPGFLSIHVDVNVLTATFYDANAAQLYSTQIFHNETLTTPDNRILGLQPTTVYILAFVGTFAVIGLGVLGVFVYQRIKQQKRSARDDGFELPLDLTEEDTTKAV